MSDSSANSRAAKSVEAAAAQWLARRDRGLSAAEQAGYTDWLQENFLHETAIARLERTWAALDQLAVNPAFQSGPADPDLLARPRRRRLLWFCAPWVAAAAALAMVYFHETAQPLPSTARQAIVHPGPERLTLADGSVVELNTHAKVEVNFTTAERRVRLVSGEAFFTVAKNPLRPFIVSANQVAVRAVGTAFSVNLASREISVLVTEGRVRVDEVTLPSGEQPPASRPLSALSAGEQGVITFAAASPVTAPAVMTVSEVSPAQVDAALFWRGVRLEFVDTPLGQVVAEFNRYNEKKLVVRDAATAAIQVGGNFRADNVDAFVRLLDVGFGISAFPANGEIILRKAHDH